MGGGEGGVIVREGLMELELGFGIGRMGKMRIGESGILSQVFIIPLIKSD